MLADAPAAALFAFVTRPPVCSQMPLPPHSLHVASVTLPPRLAGALAAAVLASATPPPMLADDALAAALPLALRAQARAYTCV